MPCQAKFPHNCFGSIVPAHSNLQIHGRGHGHKAADCFFAALCPEAHREIDSGKWSREQRETEFNLAYVKTQVYLWENGLVRVT